MSVFSKLKEKVTGITEEEQTMVDEFKATIKTNYDHKLGLDDAEALDIIKQHLPESEDESDVEAAQDAAIEALLDADDTYDANGDDNESATDEDKDVTAPKSARQGDSSAVALADKISGNAKLTAQLHEYVENESRRKTAPAHLGFYFHKTLDEDTILGEPVPGSRYDDKDEDGNDLYGVKGKMRNVKFDVRKPGKDGGGSYYQDAANATPEGRGYITDIEEIKAAISPEMQTPPKYKHRSRTWLEAELKTKKDNLTALKNAIKTGMACAMRMHTIKKETKLYAQFRTEGQGDKETVVRSHACIEVFYLSMNKATGKEVMINRYVAPSTFLRVDFAKIGEHDSPADQLDAFVAKKGANDTDKKDDEKNIVINSSDTFADAMFELAGRKADRDFDLAVSRAVAAAIKKPSDEGDEFLDCMVTVEEWLHSKNRHPDVKKRVAEYRNKLLKAEKKEEKEAA